MFGRKKTDAPKEPTKAAGPAAAKPALRVPSAPSLNLRKPLPAQPASGATSRIADIPGMMPPRSEVRSYGVEGKTLVVGREISLTGQIAACDKLVVEGRVECELEHCRQLDISPTGYFKGDADIDEAEICGRFEGSLTVRKRLRVRATARIKGRVTYGQIEVEAGGEISGEIELYRPEGAPPGNGPKAPVLTRAPAREGNQPVEVTE
jgi:cytoskeletal protein CcmA (bactofilin family)